MEAPEGFRNSDEDHFSESQVSEESLACSVKRAQYENCVGKNERVGAAHPRFFLSTGVECGGCAGLERSRNAGGAAGVC